MTRPFREVWGLAAPATLQQLLVAFAFVADRAIVGRAGSDALASLHVSSTLAWTVTSLLGAVGVGAIATVGRSAGAREPAAAAANARKAIVLAAALAVAVAAPLFLMRDPVLTLLGSDQEVTIAALGERYLGCVLPFVPVAAASAAAAACLQALGNARAPLVAAAACTAVHLGAAVLLVFGAGPLPALGVGGAGLATGLGFVVQGGLLARALRQELGRGWWRRASRPCSEDLVRVTLPALADKLAFHAGYLGYVGMIALLGGAAMAANQVLLAIEALGLPIAEGCAIAAAALAAQHLGGGRPDAALAAARSAAAVACAALGIFGLGLALAPDLWIAAFTDDPAVGALGRAPLYAAAAAQPFMAFAVVATAALRGAGHTRLAFAITLLAGVVVRLGATWLLAFELELGLAGAWLASMLDWLVQAVLVLWALGLHTRSAPRRALVAAVALPPALGDPRD